MRAYNSLKAAYYEKLDDLGIDYFQTDEMDSTPEHRVFQTVIADEYANPTLDEMCDTLGMDKWVKAWAIDVIESEGIDTGTDYGTVRITNNFKFGKVL